VGFLDSMTGHTRGEKKKGGEGEVAWGLGVKGRC